jgi:hypothetical protein
LFCSPNHHCFSKINTQTGMIIIPPHSLPFGGQITRINTTNVERSPSFKHRSLSKDNNNQQIQIFKINS